MMALMRSPFFLVLALLVSCGDDASQSDDSEQQEDGANSDGSSSGQASCNDEDGDGYGAGCKAGEDCNDADDTVSVECTCTEVAEGCACAEGTEPVECKLPKDQVREGTLLCKTGMRYCQDGKWTACVGLASFQNDVAKRP